MRQGLAGFYGNQDFLIKGFFRGAYSVTSIAPVPTFTGTIPDVIVPYDSGSYNYDYSTYYTGATSYSISPTIEAGWSFDANTGILTIDTDGEGVFGPYTVTGTSSGGGTDSNTFTIDVKLWISTTDTPSTWTDTTDTSSTWTDTTDTTVTWN